jgi:radical SAM-linked protein
MECLVARGDRQVANVVYSAWKKGARFDGWNETFDFDLWMEAVEENNIDLAKYMGTIRMDGRLPWDHIDVGLEDKFLEREWKKATKDRLSPPCGKPAGAIVHHSTLDALEKTHDEQKKPLVCYHCGVTCDLQGMIDERKEYLVSLKSYKEEPYEKPEHIGQDITKMRPKREQNIGHKYRFEFTKIGSISFISHLDLQKVMARIFKRLNIKVLYSEGYNPRPLFSFGPALSLGISSLSEWFDVRVEEAFDSPEEMLKLINEHSEKGIFFHSIKEIRKKDLSIQEAITSYDYFIPVEETKESEVLQNWNDNKDWTITVEERKTKKEIEKNLRSDILDLSLGELETPWLDTIHEVSPCKGKKGYFVRAKAEKGRTIRPRELQMYFDNLGCKASRPIKVKSEMANPVSV